MTTTRMKMQKEKDDKMHYQHTFSPILLTECCKNCVELNNYRVLLGRRKALENVDPTNLFGILLVQAQYLTLWMKRMPVPSKREELNCPIRQLDVQAPQNLMLLMKRMLVQSKMEQSNCPPM